MIQLVTMRNKRIIELVGVRKVDGVIRGQDGMATFKKYMRIGWWRVIESELIGVRKVERLCSRNLGYRHQLLNR